MNKQIALGELRGTPTLTAIENLLRKSTVLISVSSNLSVGGSGTLVRYKNIQGILTATHVVANSIDIKYIWSPVIRTKNPHIFLNDIIPIQRVVLIESSAGISLLAESVKNDVDNAAGTLDICLIQLDKVIFEKILEMSGKVAVDLYENQIRYLLDPAKFWALENAMNWSWGVYGSPREEVSQDVDRIMSSPFDGLYLGSGNNRLDSVNLTHVVPDYCGLMPDICVHEIGPTKDILPIDFRGISGGGVTQIALGLDTDGSIRIVDNFFAGVVILGGFGFLESRGPVALYEIFTKHLHKIAQS